MSSLTPQEYADMLGLKPGLDIEPSKILTVADMDSLNRWCALSNDHHAPKKLSVRFWREFGSLYLPSLLSTYFDHTFVYDPDTSAYWCILGELIYKFGNTPGLDRDLERYASRFPEKVVFFILLAINRMNDAADIEDPAMANVFLHWFLAVARQLLDCLITSHSIPEYMRLLSHTTLGEPGDATISNYGSLRCRIRPKSLEVFDGFVGFFKDCVSGTVLRTRTTDREPEDDGSSWFYRCELFPDEQLVPGRRVVPAEGVRRLECGRCRAVHYCSRAHQKEDWKKHKLVCFPPGW